MSSFNATIETDLQMQFARGKERNVNFRVVITTKSSVLMNAVAFSCEVISIF